MRPDSVPDLGAIQVIYLLTYLLKTTIAIYRLSRYFFTIFIVDEILTIAHPYTAVHIIWDNEYNVYVTHISLLNANN